MSTSIYIGLSCAGASDFGFNSSGYATSAMKIIAMVVRNIYLRKSVAVSTAFSISQATASQSGNIVMEIPEAMMFCRTVSRILKPHVGIFYEREY